MMIGKSLALARTFARCYRPVSGDIVFVQELTTSERRFEVALSAKE